MRLGFKGETQVTDQLTVTASGNIRSRATALKTKTTLDPCGIRRSEIPGCRFFRLRRNYGVVYDVTSWTDVLPEFVVTPTVLTTSCSSVVTASRPP